MENNNDKLDRFINLKNVSKLPLTSYQKRLWTVYHLDELNPSYNLGYTYKFNGNLDYNLFLDSMNILFKRHNAMFSTFKQVDEELYCEIKPRPVSVEFHDFSEYPKEEGEGKIFSFIIEDKRKPFDIEKGPLYRFYLLKLDEETSFFHTTIHHIIFDGWSWSVFVEETARIYNRLFLKQKGSLELPLFQSYDYAYWEKEVGIQGNGKELIEFWKENLKDSHPEIKFPLDSPRKNVPTGLGGSEHILIPADTVSGLKEISKIAKTSMFRIMISALGLMFQKYSGENDICLGTFVANRSKEGMEKTFGMFVDTVVIRLTVGEDITFSKYINYAKNVVHEAIAHKDLPFERVVNALKPDRISNINPFFQIALSWWGNFIKPLELGEIIGNHITLSGGVSPFDITIYLWEKGEQIEGEIEYNIDILNRDTIIHLKDNFFHLLKSVAENPDLKISELSIASENDKKKLDEFNRTEVPVPECLIQDFFEKYVRKSPDKTAVISKSYSLTYHELDEQANKLSRHLIDIGVASGDVVGICVDRSAEMIIAILGVLKSGGCYLPLDPTFPVERLNYMYEDSGAKVIISQNSLKDKLKDLINTSFVFIDSDWRRIKNNIPVKPDIHSKADMPAYIIYTSGSTGKPKGVKVPHKAVVNLINSMSKTPGINENDVLLAVVTMSFDMSVFEFFLPLSNGATIVVATNEDTIDSSVLINLIEKYNVTIIQATPAFWNILLSSKWGGKTTLKALCGGEALTLNFVRQLISKVGELWNCYGPTEATVYSTCMRITDPNNKILIGKPIDNTKIYILDKYNKLLPLGVTGEVCIGGLGVVTGYINQPDLTAEKFIRFNSQVIYKTGDQGKYQLDGNIELFGRIDNQIKIRGFRIEPGEIEIVLSQIKGINEAVVGEHKFNDNDRRLIAFLNISDSFNMDTKEINRLLKEKLPSYMVPSAYKYMHGFPKTMNGKIDRKALEFVISESGTGNRTDLKTLTRTEKVICRIWRRVLRTEDFTITDNFFDIGGNSLMAISVFSKIESVFNVDLGLRIFFDSPRIIDLAETIDISLKKSAGQKPLMKNKPHDLKIVKGEI